MQLSGNVILLGSLAVPCLGLLVIFGNHLAVVRGRRGLRVLLAHLYLGHGVACIRLGQQGRVDTRRLARGRRHRQRKCPDQHHGEFLPFSAHKGSNRR